MKTIIVRNGVPEAAQVSVGSEDGKMTVMTHDGHLAVGDTIHEAADKMTARFRGNK